MKKTVLFIIILAGLFAQPVKASLRNPPPAPGRIQAQSMWKFMYTFREEDKSTGVEGVSEAAVRWAGIVFTGMVSDNIFFQLEFAGGSGIYGDPLYEDAADVTAGPFEMGKIGVRRARIVMELPRKNKARPAVIRLGTFMPKWGIYQDRSVLDWDFIDLPLMYRHDSFHGMGWQNTGAAVDLYPLSWFQSAGPGPEVVATLFAINGYFPTGLANSQPPLANGDREADFGFGGRIAFRSEAGQVYGGFYEEGFREDRSGDKDPENYRCRAWLAGAEYREGRWWALIELSALEREDYQLEKDGGLADKESLSVHVSGGHEIARHTELLVRWDWLDPNTSDSGQTLDNSKNDRTTAWTLGINRQLSPDIELMMNYVMLFEEGKRADVSAGRTGGVYRDRDNNYFRLQLQVRL